MYFRSLFLQACTALAVCASQSPKCTFRVTDGHDNWDYVAGWRDVTRDQAWGRVPKLGDSPAIDSASPVRVPSGTDAYGGTTVVGSKYGVGHTSVLKFESGSRYFNTAYGSFYVGDAPGATGVVSFVGASIPLGLDVYNGTTNLSYVYVGADGGAGFVTNSAGTIYLREGFFLGNGKGSFGRYVHDNANFTFSFGSKPFAVGVEGRGELEVTSGTLSIQDLLVGGTNLFDSVATVRTNATLAFNARAYFGGYTNRMNNTCREYPTGHGVLKLAGGRLLSRSSEHPTVRVGCYPEARGEIRGYGSLAREGSARLTLALGHGRVVADGGVLDVSAITSLTNVLADSSAGWYAVNGGEVKLPAVSATSPSDVMLGLSPDMVNSVRVSETGAAASTHVFDCTVCAEGCEGMPPLPYNHASFGIVRIRDFRSFASVSVAVRYDPSAFPAESEVALYRLEGGEWRRVAKTAVSPDGIIAADNLAPASEDCNVGAFAVLAVGETLTFRPVARTNTSATTAYWDWSSAQNWVKRDGVTTKRPADGDELEVNVNPGGYHAANLSSYVAGLRLGRGFGNMNFSHNGFRLLGGGEGMVSEVDAGTMHTMWTSWYCDGDAMVNVTSSFNVTGSFVGRSSSRPGRIVKLGPGSITCATGGVYWTGATIREGAFTIKGTVERGLEFRFDGNFPSAYLALSNSLELAGGVLSSSTDLPRTLHGVSDFNLGRTLAITGAPTVHDQYFCGGLHGSTSFRFAPDDASASFTFARSDSSTTGSIHVDRGVVRFADGVTFTNLDACVLASNASRLEVDGAGELAFKRLEVAAGAKLTVGSGCEIGVPAGALVVNGVSFPYGVYATNAANGAVAVDWLKGGGAVCVGGCHAKTPATPYLAADGWYEFGNRSWKTSVNPWYSTMAMPDFSRLYFPAGSKVRFVGGIIFGTFPENVSTFDWSGCTGFGVVSPTAFRNLKITVPAGCRFWYMPCSEISSSGGIITRTLHSNPAAVPLPQDLEMNGEWTINDTTCSIVTSGRLSGVGTITQSNFYRVFTHTGEWAFSGTLAPRQCGNDCILRPKASSGTLAQLKMGGGYNGSSSYTPTFLSWDPSASANPVMSVGLLTADLGGFNSTNGFRYGSAVSTFDGGEVRIGSMKTAGNGVSKGIHFLADSALNNKTRAKTGRGRFTVGEISAGSYLYLYDGVDFAVTNILAATTFDFSAETDVVNRGTFSVKGACPTSCKAVADCPQQLPQALTGYSGAVELRGRKWRTLLDFDDIAGCERAIGASWQYPATGVVEVVWSKGTPIPGRHLLLSFPAGSPLANASKWKSTIEVGRTSLFTIERTSTALYVVVPNVSFPMSFYVDSEAGSDSASGVSPDTAWRTLSKVNSADIRPGESVLFKRGGLWRGQLVLKCGEPGRRLTYGNYGEGPLPILQGSADALGAGAWTAHSSGIWKSRDTFSLDVGNIIVDHGVTNGWKKWKLADCTKTWDFLYDRNDHHVYLRHPSNPGTVCSSLELALDQHVVNHANCHDTTVEGLAVRYGAAHGFGGSSTRRMLIRNCDIYWIGGGVLGSEVKADGSITRFGNGIEWWGSSDSNVVTSNRLWEIYDAAMTDQSDTGNHTNLVWSYNLVWNSEYAYEHFNRSKDYTVVDITVEHNTFVDSGLGWGNVQRPDPNSAPLMIWYSEGPTVRFDIRDNIFAISRQQGVRMTTDWHTRVTLRNNLWWLEDEHKLFRLVNTWYDLAGLVSLGLGDGSKFADPLFRNAAEHDYHLLPGSPARGMSVDGSAAGAWPAAPIGAGNAIFVR